MHTKVVKNWSIKFWTQIITSFNSYSQMILLPISVKVYLHTKVVKIGTLNIGNKLLLHSTTTYIIILLNDICTLKYYNKWRI